MSIEVKKILTRLRQIQAERTALDAEQVVLLNQLDQTAAVSTPALSSSAHSAVIKRNQRFIKLSIPKQ